MYRVSALGGQLDIQVVNGAFIGRGVSVDSNGVAVFSYSVYDQSLCFGTPPQFVFKYTFDFNLNGTGSASVHWTYGNNTNCAVCAVDDTATLLRISGPGP